LTSIKITMEKSISITISREILYASVVPTAGPKGVGLRLRGQCRGIAQGTAPQATTTTKALPGLGYTDKMMEDISIV
jgi:hypothetical protein